MAHPLSRLFWLRPGATRLPAASRLSRPLSALLATCALGGLGSGSAAAASSAAQPDCLGERQPLTVASQMPYALVSVGGRQGYMVLDFGASLSSITPENFQGPTPPQSASGTAGRFDDFVFFGTWGAVQLLVQPQPAVQTLRTADGQATIRQAGVMGTDILAQHVYTLDYRAGHLWRAPSNTFCSDAALQGAGYRPISTRDYYGTSSAGLSCPRAGAAPGGCVNIPTVSIRIGSVAAVAQLDTGYDDSRQPYSVNINGALFDALKAAGVKLTPRPDIAVQLSTCQPGISERVEAYNLAGATPFGFVDTAGRLLARGGSQVTLFVKRTPAAAAVCGGIGTWAQPAAQLGASFVTGGSLVVDPFSARVWLR
jgi:hypothetical protein